MQEYQIIKEKESLIYGSQNTNGIYSSHMSGMEVIAAPRGLITSDRDSYPISPSEEGEEDVIQNFLNNQQTHTEEDYLETNRANKSK